MYFRDSQFATFLTLMTQPLVAPFERLTQSIPINETQSFETPAALALPPEVVYRDLLVFPFETGSGLALNDRHSGRRLITKLPFIW